VGDCAAAGTAVRTHAKIKASDAVRRRLGTFVSCRRKIVTILTRRLPAKSDIPIASFLGPVNRTVAALRGAFR
jgi:hypothetical protein